MLIREKWWWKIFFDRGALIDITAAAGRGASSEKDMRGENNGQAVHHRVKRAGSGHELGDVEAR